MTANNILNRSIWDFIHDVETKHIHEILLIKVRVENRKLKLPFRCDSPNLCRYIDMAISLLDDGIVQYCCQITKTEERYAVMLFSGEVKDKESMLRVCSWCKKIDTGNETWSDAEVAIKALNLFSSDYMPEITHTMCNECYTNINDQI